MTNSDTIALQANVINFEYEPDKYLSLDVVATSTIIEKFLEDHNREPVAVTTQIISFIKETEEIEVTPTIAWTIMIASLRAFELFKKKLDETLDLHFGITSIPEDSPKPK